MTTKGVHCGFRISKDADEVPTNGPIDDLTVAKLLASKKSPKSLSSRWPVEIDRRGMVKTTRMPLGFAAKVYATQGMGDRNDHIVTPGEEGWYHRWLGDLHMLCGQEGPDVYQHRPSHEDKMKEMWYFDMKSAYQKPRNATPLNLTARSHDMNPSPTAYRRPAKPNN